MTAVQTCVHCPLHGSQVCPCHFFSIAVACAYFIKLLLRLMHFEPGSRYDVHVVALANIVSVSHPSIRLHVALYWGLAPGFLAFCTGDLPQDF